MIGVQEEIERLTKRVEEAEEVMLGLSNLCKLIDRLEVSDNTFSILVWYVLRD